MKKYQFKKLLLSSLIALQLANNVEGNNSISNVYAQTENEDLISLDEDGKILQLVGIRIGDYESITFGYIYRKDSNVYLKDAIKGRIYNITNLDQNYIPIKLIYTEAENVLSDELKSKSRLTKEELEETAEKISIISITTYQPYVSQFEEGKVPFVYQTFESKEFDNSCLPITNDGLFSGLGLPLTDDYDETKQDVDTSNKYTLGIYQNTGVYSYYSNIYATDSVGESDKMGIIICYYIFDENNTRIATLRTQEQIDTFIELNAENIDKYTWKAAFYNGTDIKQILENIDSNIPVSLNKTTYFIYNSNNKTKTLSIN